MPPGVSDLPCMRVCVCASHTEALRCWQGCHIRPVALNSLCQLLQDAIDAPIT